MAASWPRASLRLHGGFQIEALPPLPATPDGTVLRQGSLRLRAAVLDHGTPCLGFVVEEAMHLNVWRTRLEERRLQTGPWLAALKAAVAEGRPDGYSIPVYARASEAQNAPMLPLGALRDLISVTPGQRLACLTDFADTPANCTAAALARGAISCLLRHLSLPRMPLWPWTAGTSRPAPWAKSHVRPVSDVSSLFIFHHAISAKRLSCLRRSPRP